MSISSISSSPVQAPPPAPKGPPPGPPPQIKPAGDGDDHGGGSPGSKGHLNIKA